MQLRRIGVLGDIHGEHERLEVALEWFSRAGVDAVLAVGDIVDGPGDVERAIALLRTHGVIAVAGNHERWFLGGSMRSLPHATEALSAEARSFLAGLPRTRSLPTVAGDLLLCHGIGEDDMTKLTPDSSDYDLDAHEELQRILSERRFRFIVGGHTHRPMVRTIAGVVVINAGTLYREHEPCVAILDFGTGEYGHLPFDETGRTLIEDSPS